MLESRIIVRYSALKLGLWPSIPLNLPQGWEDNSFEGAITSQPEWQDNNHYFSGPIESEEEARHIINKMFEIYQNMGYVGRYVIEVDHITI